MRVLEDARPEFREVSRGEMVGSTLRFAPAKLSSKKGAEVNEDLYPNWMSDPLEYDAAVSFWTDLLGPIIVQAPRVWKIPWSENVGVDGTPFRDGNPMFSAVAVDGSRGFLIREELLIDAPEIFAWINRYGEGDPSYADGLGMPVLVLTSQRISGEIALAFSKMLESWAVLETMEDGILKKAESLNIATWF
jgi:hypothetical protein